MTWDTLFMLVFTWPVIFSLIFHIRPELERIHKLLAKKIKETNKKTHCKPKWHETHCLYSFSCRQSFFHCYFTCRTKIRKNILVISQKKTKKQKKKSSLWPQTTQDYTVQGQGLVPIGPGSTRPDPNRARVRPDFWHLGPALMGSRAKESDLARPGPTWGRPSPTLSEVQVLHS